MVGPQNGQEWFTRYERMRVHGWQLGKEYNEIMDVASSRFEKIEHFFPFMPTVQSMATAPAPEDAPSFMIMGIHGVRAYRSGLAMKYRH